jgi:dihydroorotate dehydrogenase electron transfer subunit
MAKVQEDAQILDQQEVAERTFRLRLRSERIASTARPGQFLMIEVHKGTDPLLKRPFSFHRIVPEEGLIEILYRVVGQGTWRLSKCPPGMRLNILGPLGNGFSPAGTDHHPLVLIAGGIGIAPLHELMVQLTANRSGPGGSAIHLFYGTRTSAELIPTGPYERMGITVHCSTDDGSFGYHGYVTQFFEFMIRQEPRQPMSLYSCGPLVMLYHVARWSLAHNVPAQLSLESLMACGIGACLGCALPAPHPHDSVSDHYLHVCKDGPIFQAGSIAWTKLQRQPTAPQTYLYN